MAAARGGIRPKVSVITIFYNAERHFREAIDSVLAQDFDGFELLLVDDGSEDSSTAIAKDYARSDKRVRYLQHPGHANLGMSAARNLGLSKARGEMVAFIDADDRWRPSKLREQIALLDKMPEVDAVGGSVNYWSSHSGGKDEIVATGHAQDRLVPPAEATLAMYPLGKAHAPSMSDLLFRRESIDRVRGFEEAFRGGYEDQAFLAKYYLASTLYFTTRVWSDYRLHADSCMAELARTGAYHSTRKDFLLWFKAYVARGPHREDAHIQRALERALRQYAPARARLANVARAVPFAIPIARKVRAGAKRLRAAIAPGPAILMYHRIADERFDPWSLAVSPDNFAEHLEWIAHNRTVLPLAELAELHRLGKLPRDAIAVTFDDGYACNAETAAPLLHRFGVPATIFISPDLIALGREFWWDELEKIVLSHKEDSISLGNQEFHLGRHSPDEGRWASASGSRSPRQKAYGELWAILYEMDWPSLQSAMAQLREQAGLSVSPRPSHRPMTVEEIRSLASELIAFGSHAMTHPSLPKLNDHGQEREIAASVTECALISGATPATFAYPYGDYAPGLDSVVRKAGFVCACRADGSFVRPSDNLFALPRIHVADFGSRQLAQLLGRP